jgi:hypothetical protein
MINRTYPRPLIFIKVALGLHYDIKIIIVKRFFYEWQ